MANGAVTLKIAEYEAENEKLKQQIQVCREESLALLRIRDRADTCKAEIEKARALVVELNAERKELKHKLGACKKELRELRAECSDGLADGEELKLRLKAAMAENKYMRDETAKLRRQLETGTRARCCGCC